MYKSDHFWKGVVEPSEPRHFIPGFVSSFIRKREREGHRQECLFVKCWKIPLKRMFFALKNRQFLWTYFSMKNSLQCADLVKKICKKNFMTFKIFPQKIWCAIPRKCGQVKSRFIKPRFLEVCFHKKGLFRSPFFRP